MNTQCQHINSNNLTFSVAGKQIFKDQCMRCYDDQRSDAGLNVCLKCFSSHCQSEMFNHTALHSMHKGHNMYLNMKQVRIESEEKVENSSKITKLAIGKPGGADFSGEQWERWLKVHCSGCQVDIDYSHNTQLTDLVNSIVNTSDANQQTNIKEWEEELFPCEHTLTLVQNESIQIASKMLATCGNCNISSNLWLCMTCGQLGCGRKNYDGTGGNNHAIAHFENTKHPLVVKTGTITPEGDASIYCYACDNDVKDGELATHLSHLGIDITTQKKTDKTVTELNLEMNLNFTLSKTIEDGKVFVPVYGAGNTGLENLGNSCYMNSVIQVLFSLESFQQLYLDNAVEHLSTCVNDTQNCFYCQVGKLMYGMYSGAYSVKKTRSLPITDENSKENIEEYQDGVRPSSFKQFFGKDHPEFSSGRQQDAFEYMAYILEKFERQERMSSRPNPKSLFEYDLETRLECTKCNGVKYKTQRTCFLTLSVPNWQAKKEESSICTIEECLAKFIGEELVDLNCPVCKLSTPYVKTQRMKTFPTYLIVVYERFVYDWVPIKLEVAFKPPTHNFNFDILASSHSKPNEYVIPTDESEEFEEIEPVIDSNALNLLMSNGIPELAAKHALLLNQNNADFAIGWYFENMENPSKLNLTLVLETPIKKVRKQNEGGSNNLSRASIPEHLVNELLSMGFSQNQAEGSLRKCDNSVDRAIDYLFSHPEENFEEQSQVSATICDFSIPANNSSIYDLYSFITHLGKNTSHGHYVCHINKGSNWIYYNDSKVSISEDPPIHKGYLYIYKSK